MTNLELTDNSPDHFPGALIHWGNHLRSSEHARHTFDEAFELIDQALLKTAMYLTEKLPDKDAKHELSQLWMRASRAVAPIDPDFAESMAYKGLGWANPYYWDVAKDRGYKIDVNDVQRARTLLAKRRQQLEIERNSIDVFAAPAHIHAGNPVLIVTLIFAGIFGLGCIYGGTQLMLASGTGETVFNFFGLQFSTKQAGVAAIALGAATIILTFGKVLKTIVELGRI